VAAVFCGRVESGGDGADVGSAIVHTLCFINCDTEETDTLSLPTLFTMIQTYYFKRIILVARKLAAYFADMERRVLLKYLRI